VSLPFWLALPVGIAVAVVWAVAVLVAGVIDGICWLVRRARAGHAG
jgi:uncharacterized protein YneF (UPF0154 family)